MTSMSAGGRETGNLLGGRGGDAWLASVGEPAMVTGLTLIAAILRFLRLGHQGLWYDESYTMMLVRQRTPGRMLRIIPRTESTPPLYYCVAWVWVRLVGRGASGLRSLSAIAGTGLVPLAYGSAGEVLRSRRAGVVCAALTAFNPLLWWYSQEARAYELLTLLCAASLLTFARALRDPSTRRIVLWALTCALALCTHYFAAMLVVPEAVWLLAVHRRRSVRVAVALVGACGCALLPLLTAQAARHHDAWIGRAPLSLRLSQVIPQFLIGTGALDRSLLKFVALTCAALAFALLATTPPRIRRGARVAGGLALAGAAIALVLIPLGFDELLTRNLIELWLPLAMCAAGGLACTRYRRLGALGTVVLCAAGLAAIIGVLGDPRLQRPAWPALVRVLGSRPPARQARLIVVQRERGLMPLAVYLPHLEWLNGSRRISQLDVVAMGSAGPGAKFCWWGSECNLVPSPLQATYRLAGFSAVRRLRVGQFRVLEMRARRPTLVTRRELSRALTVTHLPSDGLLLQL